jgi:2,3-bisphosphoglycerate-dependent phosphoglycerate mutase
VTKLYFIRHGQSNVNVEGLTGGHKSDKGLTPLGVQQAERLRDRLLASGEIKADVLIASPLPRARQTAEIIQPALGNLPIMFDSEVEEIRLSDDLETTKISELLEKYGPIDFADHDKPIFPGSESRRQFYARFENAINRIAEENFGKTVVIVAHGGIIDASLVYLAGIDRWQLGAILPYYTLNTSLTLWQRQWTTFTNSYIWTLIKYNDVLHTADIESTERFNWSALQQVYNQRNRISEAPPLHNRRIIVTRAKEQANGFTSRLLEFGAEVLNFPVIKIVELDDYTELDAAIDRLPHYNWLIFTSANAADHFFRRYLQKPPTNCKVCAIGAATAEKLDFYGVTPDLMPEKAVAESVVEALGDVSGQRILFPAAELARETIVEGLEAKGATVDRVTVYRNIVPEDEPEGFTAARFARLLEIGQVDLVTFTSASTVKNLGLRLANASTKPYSELLGRTPVACIGPITSAAAREAGLNVVIEASEHNTNGLTDAIVSYFTPPAELVNDEVEQQETV